MEAKQQHINVGLGGAKLNTRAKHKHVGGKQSGATSTKPTCRRADAWLLAEEDQEAPPKSSTSEDTGPDEASDDSGVLVTNTSRRTGLIASAPIKSQPQDLAHRTIAQSAGPEKTVPPTTNGARSSRTDVKHSIPGTIKEAENIHDKKSSKSVKANKAVATPVCGGARKKSVSHRGLWRSGFTSTKHAIHAANFITSASGYQKISDVDRKVLTGCLHGIPPLSSNIVRIFISSTFSGKLRKFSSVKLWNFSKVLNIYVLL